MRLWRKEPATREGKYLVELRGKVFPHPCMVLGGRDPAAPEAIRSYARAVSATGVGGLLGLADGGWSVTRRDGTKPDWPFVVLRADDVNASAALSVYADACEEAGMDPLYCSDLRALVDDFIDHALANGAEPESSGPGFVGPYVASLERLALSFEEFLSASGAGDPDGPRHRRDDPATVEKMRSGRCA